jgi:hypothetical protein
MTHKHKSTAPDANSSESESEEKQTHETEQQDSLTPVTETNPTTANQETPEGTVDSVPQRKPKDRFNVTGCVHAYWSHKRWTFPITLLALVIIAGVIPYTRYRALGLFLKETVSISVMDSTTQTPISGVHIQAGGITATTSSSGKTSMRLPVGDTTFVLSKQYYKNGLKTMLVSYVTSQDTLLVRLVATGRQVPITVLNKITGKPIADAELKVLSTEAKTDAKGSAIIVLPVGQTTLTGTLSASGYNTASEKIQVTSQTIPANSYLLTPSGSVYFLSNLSGKVDVVSTNLDGTNRQTVLAGTGNESPTSTILLASRDWKYLALLAQRNKTGNPELDLIDTSTNTMSNIDEGNATFTLVGWDGDRFVYTVNRSNVQAWQNGQQAIKSFNAPTKSLITLAQTTASGTSTYDFARQQLGATYIVTNKVVYTLNWSGAYAYTINGKQATVNTINPDGTENSIVQSFSPAANTQPYGIDVEVQPYDNPTSLAISFYDGTSDKYYEYQDGKITPSSELTNQNFYGNNYATYLQSPSGNQTFWSEPTDGKNNLLVGDTTGSNGNKVAVLSDYNPYGWFTDSYLLVSKNSSELYIMPVDGGTPLAISDYFKPSQFFSGYGGGYGGL